MAVGIAIVMIIGYFIYYLIKDIFLIAAFIHTNTHLSPLGYQMELDYAYAESRRMLQFLPKDADIFNDLSQTDNFAETNAGKVIQNHPLVLAHPEIWNAVLRTKTDSMTGYIHTWMLIYARFMTAQNGKAPYCLANPPLGTDPVRIPSGDYWPIRATSSLANSLRVSRYDTYTDTFERYDRESVKKWDRLHSRKRKAVVWEHPAGAPYYEWQERGGKDFVALAQLGLPQEYLDYCQKQICNPDFAQL